MLHNCVLVSMRIRPVLYTILLNLYINYIVIHTATELCTVGATFDPVRIRPVLYTILLNLYINYIVIHTATELCTVQSSVAVCMTMHKLLYFDFFFKYLDCLSVWKALYQSVFNINNIFVGMKIKLYLHLYSIYMIQVRHVVKIYVY